MGFSSAAATGSYQHTIVTTNHESYFNAHTGLSFIHGRVGIGFSAGIVVRLASFTVALFTAVLALGTFGVGVVIGIL